MAGRSRHAPLATVSFSLGLLTGGGPPRTRPSPCRSPWIRQTRQSRPLPLIPLSANLKSRPCSEIVAIGGRDDSTTTKPRTQLRVTGEAPRSRLRPGLMTAVRLPKFDRSLVRSDVTTGQSRYSRQGEYPKQTSHLSKASNHHRSVSETELSLG